jgi:CSLREA domain-containing protein
LYYRRGSLIAVQTVRTLERVVRFDLDARGRRIDVISPPSPEDAADEGGARSLSAGLFSSSAALEVSGEPVAVLPMRLNEDGVSDLVVLRSGSITPAVVLSAPALSLTVNSNGDTGDASPGNGICADSNGNCTLRAAIQEANASAGADTINFAIAGAGIHTITTGSSLPAITGAVTINGTTQPGYAGLPLIEVKGATGQIGLTIRVSDCVVRGLAVNGYEASGQTGGVGIYIVSSGPLVKNALLEANFIGTDPAGTTAKPNHLGIDFENTSLHTVGGTTAAARNLISGNSLVGIQVIGPAASGNTFQGNYVGTTANGSAALPNAFAGFNLFANNTVVGGPAAGAGNVISGNGGGGLFTSQFCAPSCFGSGTVVKANKIGTNPAGDAAVGNTRGVLTSSPGSPNTTIANNLISGNPNGGIQIDESLTTVTNITGNFIGTDVTGTLALGNGSNGGILIHTTVATAQINVGGATGTTPGGSCTGSCNLISANSQYGIYAFGSGPVSIIYNYIGTDVTGTQALGNDSAGVVLAAAGKTLGSAAASGPDPRRKGSWRRRSYLRALAAPATPSREPDRLNAPAPPPSATSATASPRGERYAAADRAAPTSSPATAYGVTSRAAPTTTIRTTSSEQEATARRSATAWTASSSAPPTTSSVPRRSATESPTTGTTASPSPAPARTTRSAGTSSTTTPPSASTSEATALPRTTRPTPTRDPTTS